MARARQAENAVELPVREEVTETFNTPVLLVFDTNRIPHALTPQHHLSGPNVARSNERSPAPCIKQAQRFRQLVPKIDAFARAGLPGMSASSHG